MDGFAAATTGLGPDRHIRQHGPARVCRAAAYLAVALGLAAAVPAAAHPLGNDSITHFNVLYVLPDRLEVDYLLDLAENPTQFIESGEMDSDKNGQVSREEQENWLGRKVTEYANFLSASIDGEPLSLSLVPEQIDPNTGAKSSTSKIIVPMLGPMGMTYRIVIRYVAHYPDALGPGEHVIRYEDKTYPQHRGLKLVLLEPTPFLCRLYDIPANVLQPGPVPPAIVSALADEALGLQEPATARLEPAAQAVDGRSRWRLSDGERQLSLTVREDAIDVSVLPYCEFIAPDVPLVSEDNAAFRYEQYDPVNLPDVRRATVRFTVVGEHGEQRAASRPVQAAGASRPAGDVEPTGVATAAPADPGLPHHASDFLDPNYNPIKRSEYERQAEKMIGLLQGRWSPVVLLLVTALAFGWGAAHALMPGHAKTVVAAYLISQRGTYWHAAVLAVIVTVTHTALVVIMGLVIWYFQESNPRLAPALQLWLGFIAGLLVMSMGLTLLWRAATGRLSAHGHDHDHLHGPDDRRSWWRRLFTHSHPHVPGADHGHPHHHGHAHAHDHSHDHGHAHPHAHAHDHVHDHGHAHAHAHSHDHGHAHEHEHASSHGHADSHGHVHADDRARPHTHSHGHAHAAASAGPGSVDHLTFRMLLVLGVTGGIVPCPSATIIMFLGIGANVVPGALYAIAVFSLGLALTLMLIGSLALASRRYAAKVLSDARHEHELSGAGRRILLQVVPALSGLAVVTLGGMIAVHYLCLMRGVTSPFPWMG